jgi:pimeloyl-ACP methyl ester carboxylesterase
VAVQIRTENKVQLKMQAQVAGKGAPLVLVPSGLTGWLSWEPHVARLAASRRVISAQLLSVEYGLEKRKLPPDYSLKTESQALAATLDELGLTAPLDLVAWCYGAAITLDYALDHPERVLTLTLVEPPALWVLGAQTPRGPKYESALALSKMIQDDVSEAQLEQFALAMGLCPLGKSPAQSAQWPVWMHHRQSLLNTSAMFRHRDDPVRLRTFRRPVLLVKGADSAEFLHQVINSLAAQLPNAQTVEMPGGHTPQLASMDRFLDQLTLFHNTAHGLFVPNSRKHNAALGGALGSDPVI